MMSISKDAARFMRSGLTGILRQLWALYLTSFLIIMLEMMTVGSKLQFKTDMICDSIFVRPPPRQTCHSDSIVSARVTRLMTIQSITLSFFSAVSTGHWCSLAQKAGHRSVLLINLLGLGLNEMIYVAVKYWDGSVNLLPLGSFLAGILGGPATWNALVTGYIHGRLTQHQLCATTGLLIGAGIETIGSALGPGIGSWVSLISNFQLLAPSYGFLFCLVPLALLICFGLSGQSPPGGVTRPDSSEAKVWSISCLEPFHALRPSARGNRNLLLLAICYGVSCFILGSSNVKLQYPTFEFNWTPTETGKYLALLGASKAVSVLVIIPGILSLCKQKSTDCRTIQNASECPKGSPPNETSHLLPHDRHELITQEHNPFSSQTKTIANTYNCQSASTSQSSLTLCPSDEDVPFEPMKRKVSISKENSPVNKCHRMALKSNNETQLGLKFARFLIAWDMFCDILLVASQGLLSFLIPSTLQTLSVSTRTSLQAIGLSLISPSNKSEVAADVISSFALIQVLAQGLFGPIFFGVIYARSPPGKPQKSFLLVVILLHLVSLLPISCFSGTSNASSAGEENYPNQNFEDDEFGANEV